MGRAILLVLLHSAWVLAAEDSGARLLRQPDISATHVAFVHGGDIWTATRSGTDVRRLTRTAEAESFPRFSPDGRLIAFTRRGDVYVMPAAGGPERRLTWHPQFDTAVGWTPDGRRIVLQSDRWKGDFSASPHVFLLPVEGGWPEPLPVPRATRASFSPDGRRFAYGPVPEVSLWQAWKAYRGGSLGYIAVFDPASKFYSELPRGQWNDVSPMWRGDSIYFLSDRSGTMNIYRYSLSSKATDRLTSYTDWDVRNASAAGDAIIYENGGRLYVLDLATQTPRRLAIALPEEARPSAAEQAEWQQAVEDAWRNYQEKSFKPASVWKDIKPRFLELMRGAAHWSDADAVLREMLAEAGQSHMMLMRSEQEAPPFKIGLLGADFRVENGRYRIAKIYRGSPSDKIMGGPLADPELGVREGDYLLAVNGSAVLASSDIYSHFDGLSGSAVKLSISETASGGGREVTVRPIGDERELRYWEWVRENRERVALATGGRIGYVHLMDVDRSGVDRFRRECLALRGKVAGLIIDARNNGGGTQPIEVINMIEQAPLRMMFYRGGEVPPMISPFIDGPKVMIVNEQSVSGGDELASFFRARKLGPLVGTRTMGGLIGNGDRFKVAGGWMLAVPEYGFFWPQSGEWAFENRGIEPEYRVEWTPADFAARRDPQLEKAIQLTIAAAAAYRKQVPEIAPYRPER